jgi:HTH-type transcriptional regulator, transcriptional repressor of NAD biosynthesis genes
MAPDSTTASVIPEGSADPGGSAGPISAQGPVGRIALLGGESSGKTTLARAITAAMGTAWVPEYGRELWEQVRRTLTAQELVHVGQRQVEMEEAAEVECARLGRRWLICDTTPLTTLQYCLHDHGSAPPALQGLAARRYDLAVLCVPDFDFVQDGCRRDDGFRRAQHDWTVVRLAALHQPTLTVRGSVQARAQSVMNALAQLQAGQRPEHVEFMA